MPPDRYVGLDLAWGERNRTGLAAIDERGALCEMRTVGTDDEIAEALRPYDDVLVGVDAPLIVRNETGTRACERDLNADFARFQAGCHPSNRSRPWFADGGRAWRLAILLDLATDPGSTARRRIIEVYPHPATVVLFGLDRTLKYKRRNRDLSTRRRAFTDLLGHLESLQLADPPLTLGGNAAWLRTRRQVEHAQRHADLDRLEDAVDAIICAYVALFAARRPELTSTYGSAADGYVVTPALPTRQPPSSITRGSPAR
jgi:predicted RNase H-like nuclease